MLHVKLILYTWIGAIAVFVKETSTSAIVAELPKSNVTVLNEKFKVNILKRIANRLIPLTNIIETAATHCNDEIKSQVDECDECVEDCKKYNKFKELMMIILGPMYLQIEVIQSIFIKARDALDMFGKDSYVYLNTLGNIGKQVGSLLLKGSDKVLQEIGTGLTEIGKQFEENSKKLLKDSFNGLHRASDEVFNAVKGSLKGIQDLGKPIMEKTTKMLNKLGKLAGTGFGKIIENVLKIKAPKIKRPKLELPKVSLPRIRPRISLPRISPRISLPRYRLPRVPRVSRGWGKKRRSLTKLLECKCPACEPFKGNQTEIIERICGKDYLSNQEKQMKESHSLNILNNFIMDPTKSVLSKVLLYLRSTGYMSFAVEKTTMVLNTPNNKSIELAMQKGIPNALNDTDIENIITEEAAEVYRILLEESVGE